MRTLIFWIFGVFVMRKKGISARCRSIIDGFYIYREAAKECRRKKKEYVKCLENRVAVLENQNKALIEELKTLKELYCRKEKSELT